MAAGNWVDWNTGDLVTAAAFQDIQDSIVFIYADETAANAALTNKVQGTIFYDTTADVLKAWDGSAWISAQTGDITEVNTASNSGLAGGATSGAVSLTLDPSNLSSGVTVDSANDLLILEDVTDGTVYKVTPDNLGIGGGKILQVVTNTDTGTTSSTGSTTYVTTTTLDTITPVAAGSKFLVTATGTANNGGDSQGSSYTIMAKVNSGSYAQFGTLNPANSAGYAQLYTNGATDAWIPTSIQVFDTVSYSLTDTITFAVHLIGKGPGTDGTTSAKWGHFAAGDGGVNTITIMEVE